jgi:hypothetical protein
MSDEDRTGSCIIQPCARDPHPDLVPVCGPHRSRLAGQLRDIPQLVEELRGEVPSDFYQGEERIEEKADHLVDLDGELAAVVRVERLHVLGVNAGAIAGQSNAPRVQGSREAPIPINVDRLDLLGPADPRTVHDLSGDQIGYPSAATVLDGWCAMFAEEQRHSVPKPQPATQSRWLLDRLDELFKHPAIDECAKEIGDLWHVLRRACGLPEPKPELCEGIPCKWEGCDLRTLYRMPVSVFEEAQYVECLSCRRLMTIEDYDDWARLNHAAVCGKRHGEWYCALAKKHEGDCEPFRGEEATA